MISFGIIGSSKGNGHPYSWSAIMNGYDKKRMEDCPYPVILEYLNKQNFPEASIKNAQIDYIWTQDKANTKHIAESTFISNIVDNIEDLIGNVDAILLARDDYQLHYEQAKPFIEAGIPIYIDKPIAITVSEALRIFALEKYSGQIFTCSALRFAQEFNVSKSELKKLGELEHIEATIAGPWDKYAIHIIEPVLNIIGHQLNISQSSKVKTNEKTILNIKWENDLTATFLALENIKAPIKIKLFGTNDYLELQFYDAFNSFKSALQVFVDICNHKRKNNCKDFALKAIEIVEKGI